MACTNKEALEFYMGGNDWEALLKARQRSRLAMSIERLSWLEREREHELLAAKSIEEREEIRAAYAELCEALSVNN